jgi:hypothetical protein
MRRPRRIIKRDNSTAAETKIGQPGDGHILDPQFLPKRADLVCDPSQAVRDLSVRLEMEVEEDWDLDFEAFCRLSRLGRFNEAKQHFRSRLQHLDTIPYLLVEYVNMLLSSGDYNAIQRMPESLELGSQGLGDGPLRRERLALKANYVVLRLMERSPTLKLMPSTDFIVGRLMGFLERPMVTGSIQVSSFRLESLRTGELRIAHGRFNFLLARSQHWNTLTTAPTVNHWQLTFRRQS